MVILHGMIDQGELSVIQPVAQCARTPNELLRFADLASLVGQILV
jgi:hypothetical protein